MTDAIKERTCLKCRQKKPITDFAATNSPYFPSHRCHICNTCLEGATPSQDLAAVDRLMRFLDLPFNPDLWLRLEASNHAHTLTAYLMALGDTDGPYASSPDWRAENARWAAMRDRQSNIQLFKEEYLRELYNRWGTDYSQEELEWLENYYNRILATQNVSTPILEEHAKDLCELELQIKKGLRAGADIKKFMDARNDIIKIANFTAANSKTASAFESIGELMMYYGKKGFKPNYYQEPKDSIDFLMANSQNYLKRLVMNEGALPEMVEEKRNAVNLTERLEDVAEPTSAAVEYEDEFSI